MSRIEERARAIEAQQHVEAPPTSLAVVPDVTTPQTVPVDERDVIKAIADEDKGALADVSPSSDDLGEETTLTEDPADTLASAHAASASLRADNDRLREEQRDTALTVSQLHEQLAAASAGVEELHGKLDRARERADAQDIALAERDEQISNLTRQLAEAPLAVFGGLEAKHLFRIEYGRPIVRVWVVAATAEAAVAKIAADHPTAEVMHARNVDVKLLYA